MPNNGVTNSVFIMQLTKEQITDAHEQGLIISTRNGNIKIVAILNDVYGVNHFNSNKVQWWLFEQFEKQEAKIEQPKPKIDLSILKEGSIYYLKSDKSSYLIKFLYSQLKDIEIIWDCNYALRNNCIYREINGIKGSFITELRLPTESELELFYSKFPELKPKPKYNGRAVKCDNLEQIKFVAKNEGSKLNIEHYTFNNWNQCIIIETKEVFELHRTTNKSTNPDFEFISFSDYCKENGITEPKWRQGYESGGYYFECGKYRDVLMVSDNKRSWNLRKIVEINKDNFIDEHNKCWIYARYPRKGEINEIKFVD